MTEDVRNIKTGVGRVSFATVHKKDKRSDKDTPKYSLDLLFDPEDPCLKRLKKAEKATIEETWPDKKTRPRKLMRPIKDGNDRYFEDEDGEVVYPSYKDKIYVSLRSTSAPEIVDKGRNKYSVKSIGNDEYEYFFTPNGGKPKQIKLEEFQEFFYSGCFAKCSIYAHGYNNPENKGVTFLLKNIMKVEDGDPLGSTGNRNDAHDDFEGDFDEDDEDDEDEDDNDY